MNNLPFIAVRLEPTRNRPFLADRQAPPRPSGMIEVNKCDPITVAIRCIDAERPSAGAAFTYCESTDEKDYIPSDQSLACSRRSNSFDGASWEMIEKINEPGDAELAEELRDPWPNSFDRFDFGEQRV
jgi:hypothetical protein